MPILLVLPLILPLLIGCSALIRFSNIRQTVALTCLFLNMLVCLLLLVETHLYGFQVVQAGGVIAPYGISLVVDSLTGVMLAISGIIGFAVGIFSAATIAANHQRFAYYPLFGFLMMGINFAFITGDLFTLYVAFEVMLMASFVLLTVGGERAQIEGGLKYVTLNLISSTIFLIAAGLTYAVAGTLNMAHLAAIMAEQPSPGIGTVLAALFLIAFGIKAAMFPLFFWLPASYHTPPIAVTALFGGLLTKVGIYSMWRVLVMIFPQELAYLQPLILVLAALTMIIGVLGAVAQTEFRRLLSFHIISQIGYLLMAIGLLTVDSMTGAVFFMVHVILAKTALFFVSGLAYELEGTYKLKKLGGLSKRAPGLALLFLLAAFSLAGFPPFSGFWGKLLLIRSGLEIGQYVIVAIALAVSLLTTYSMLKIWTEVFWKPLPKQDTELAAPRKRLSPLMLAPVGVLVGLIIAIGVFAEPMYQLSEAAAVGVINPMSYIEAVLLPGTGE